MDRYEVESIAKHAAENVCRELRSDLTYEIRRVIDDLRRDITNEMQAHKSDYHSEEI